jgi:DNA invertase Pin-like site-specific DNA recombinase
METLRFAPLVRVSTEKQKAKGESLTTQKAQIIQYVQSLKGTIPESCWEYSGQEHATPDQERRKLDKLLSDSGKGIFDAVIVCDASRWSRDNLKSKEGLKILLSNDIKFFVGTMEYDLNNPEHSFYLGISAEIGEFQARQGSLKSITNRINLAKRGVPASGLLPYGRTFNKVTEKWGLDEDKKRIIEICAQRYIAGDSLKDIARTYNMDYTNLWDILNRHSGTEYTCRFRYKNIDETVVMTIPRLLEENVIEAIYEKGKAKKTYQHGSINIQYLLSRMIFCSKCGKPYFGISTPSKRRYYRHARYQKLTCKEEKNIDANDIELAILIHLVKTLGDPERIKKAIQQATPDFSKLEGLGKERDKLNNELKKITIQKDKIVEKVSLGLMDDEDIKSIMGKLKEQIASINNRVTVINNEMENVPEPDKVKKLSVFAGKVFQNTLKTGGDPTSYILKKDYTWKRNLIEHAFAGTDSHGNRLGVYIEKTDSGWSFEIRGTLESTLLSLPLSDVYLMDLYNLDAEYCNVDDRLIEIRTNLSKLPLKLISYSINGTI